VLIFLSIFGGNCIYISIHTIIGHLGISFIIEINLVLVSIKSFRGLIFFYTSLMSLLSYLRDNLSKNETFLLLKRVVQVIT